MKLPEIDTHAFLIGLAELMFIAIAAAAVFAAETDLISKAHSHPIPSGMTCHEMEDCPI